MSSPSDPPDLQASLSAAADLLARDVLQRVPRSVETAVREETVLVSLKMVPDGGGQDPRAFNERRSRFVELLLHEVEQRTGRRVVSLLGDHDASSDGAVQVFVLDGPPA